MLIKLFDYFSVKKNIYTSRDALDILRLNLLRKQILHAYRNIPYFKKSFDDANLNPDNFHSIEDLLLYPIITKDVIRANYSQMLNHNTLSRGWFKSHTSGSTGQPMWTHYDMKSWLRKKYLVKARARIECGVKSNEKIATFEAISQHSVPKGNALFQIFKSHYKVYSIFTPYKETIQKLISFSPQALYGPSSYFLQLAQHIEKNGTQVPSIKRIFTSSEYLQETVRNYIKEIFSADVYDIYGSTEFKEVAWECETHEGYHINEDEVIVEVVNNGKVQPLGTIGNIVITDLRNKVMPLIRYQMYDKGILIDKNCNCGRTFSLMKPCAGRSSEYIILPNDEILSPYLFTTNIEKINGLLQYQIIQFTKEKILVNAVTNSEDFDRIVDTIKGILSNITNHLMEVEVQLKTKLDVEENGKFKVVKNLILK